MRIGFPRGFYKDPEMVLAKKPVARPAALYTREDPVTGSGSRLNWWSMGNYHL